MERYGLIGYPLTHSFSAEYFSEKFFREGIINCRYDLFPIDSIDNLLQLIKETKELKGLSVTIPYKQKIIPLLTSIDDVAKNIGSVNTIIIERNENIFLHGFNTDVFGFKESLKPLLKNHHKKALILGTGGAASSVAYVLNKLGIEYLFVSRTKTWLPNTIDYSSLNEDIISTHNLIINATPVGMFPHIMNLPNIPYNYITKDHLLYDLIYNPSETLFLKKGIEKGVTVKNGMEMLYLQAEKSWEIWNKSI